MPKKKNNPYYEQLKDAWVARHKQLQKEIFTEHAEIFEDLMNGSKNLAVGSLAGIFMLTSPVVPKIPTNFSTASAQVAQNLDKKVFLVYDLRNLLPSAVAPLTADQEQGVSEILTRTYGIKVAPELEGIRLNTSYGYIGQEQHLARYPGDNMLTHFDNADDGQKYFNYGMAPGLGAWRYFANSESQMTKEDSDREKYYIAVQTFLTPGFNDNPKKYTDFFKYRKMLVVNPQNGKAIVADIADAGPAGWTGKQLGGSPEVMQYLQRVDGRQKGGVLYFFIDDPDDKIPLGPINYEN